MTFGNTALLRRYKYALLLTILLAELVVQSFAMTTGAASIPHDVMTAALIVTIYVVVFARSALRTVMAAVMLACVLIGWAHYLPVARFDYALSMAGRACLAIFLWAAVWVFLRNLFRTSAIGADNVFGAICGYLIAGNGWGTVNAMAYMLAPATYLFDPKVAPLLADWRTRNALFAYYSYAHMLSIGYAGVTPLKAPATTLSLLAALFGLFYTAVIVSQLVGMAQSGRRETPHNR